MPSRIIPFINGQIYHIYNRGTEKRPIFKTKRDQQRFLKTLQYYQFAGPKPRFSFFSPSSLNQPSPDKKIVEVIAYCLMPNHFHFLLKQVRDGGITEFTSKLSNSYTKYYNTKYSRVGPLLQGEFKAIHVEEDSQLIHLSRYIHLNPVASFLVKNLDEYPWSSYEEYITNKGGFCKRQLVLDLFKSPQMYKQFILDQVSYAQELEKIKHTLIDEH